MIRIKISAVTSVTYGLLSALIIAVIVGGLSVAGVNVENVFSAAGNGIAATMGPPPYPLSTPNPALAAYQQSQITNAAAEIAAGTASAACLQNMNDNGSSMESNNATCLGPGYGIAPPALPVKVEYGIPNGNMGNGGDEVETSGLIYAETSPGYFSTTSATAADGTISHIAYLTGGEYTFPSVSFSPSDCSGGNVTIVNSNVTMCSGLAPPPSPTGGGAPW